MKKEVFDRQKHIYESNAFVELIKDAVRFFNGTPVHDIPPPERYLGRGVHALYYIGDNPIYKRYAELNRLSYDYPIYVGKAVPKGWRQSRISSDALTDSSELYTRIREHSRNIAVGVGLEVKDFACRFVIFENSSSDMISTVEAALIKLNRPLWNTALDGFGNHTPGAGRFEQAKSGWDVIHPGRAWAEKCKGKSKSEAVILANIEKHFQVILKEKQKVTL